MLDEARLEDSSQLGARAKTPPDELRAGLADECEHLRLPAVVVGSLHEDEARLALRRCALELSLCRRDAVGVLEAILGPEDTDVDLTTIYFSEIDGVRPAIAGGQILEQKRGEETLQERIALHEGLHCAALFGQLLLGAADEDPEAGSHDR